MLARMAPSPDDDTLHRGGSGEPLVLLHGFTGSWHIWKPVLPALEASYDVTAITLPGHLGRPWPDGLPMSIGALCDLVEERLAELGLVRPHVAGNSLGGWVALLLAARGSAGSVTAFSPAGGWAPGETRVPELFRKMRRTIEEAYPAADAFLADPDDRRKLMGLVLERGDRIGLPEASRMWEAVLAVDVEGVLTTFGGFTLPTLGEQPPQSIVWCGEDHLLTQAGYSEGWRTAAPYARWSVLEGAGHVPMYDDPDGVVRAIEETVSRVRRPARP